VRVNLVGSKVNILNPYTNGGAYISSTNFNRTGCVNLQSYSEDADLWHAWQERLPRTWASECRYVGFEGDADLGARRSCSDVELRGDFFNLLNMTEFKPRTRLTVPETSG